MGDIYIPIADILSDVGIRVGINSINEGWEYRSRSSGGFSSPPKGVWWHHTASTTSIENDLSWQINGCDDAPVGNATIARDGMVWPIAGGASNCAGKGGPASFSRGTVALDSGNTGGFQYEVANGGTGEAWPVAQIDAYFAASNAINAYCGNTPGDCISHHQWAPDRKIDPAKAESVEGPWRPRSINSSGTWNMDDIIAECFARAGQPSPGPGPGPGPGPIPPGGHDDMASVIKGDGGDSYYAWNGVTVTGIPGLEWVNWGVENGLYKNAEPIVYPQGFVDDLLAAQGER